MHSHFTANHTTLRNLLNDAVTADQSLAESRTSSAGSLDCRNRLSTDVRALSCRGQMDRGRIDQAVARGLQGGRGPPRSRRRSLHVASSALPRADGWTGRAIRLPLSTWPVDPLNSTEGRRRYSRAAAGVRLRGCGVVNRCIAQGRVLSSETRMAEASPQPDAGGKHRRRGDDINRVMCPGQHRGGDEPSVQYP